MQCFCCITSLDCLPTWEMRWGTHCRVDCINSGDKAGSNKQEWELLKEKVDLLFHLVGAFIC